MISRRGNALQRAGGRGRGVGAANAIATRHRASPSHMCHRMHRNARRGDPCPKGRTGTAGGVVASSGDFRSNPTRSTVVSRASSAAPSGSGVRERRLVIHSLAVERDRTGSVRLARAAFCARIPSFGASVLGVRIDAVATPPPPLGVSCGAVVSPTAPVRVSVRGSAAPGQCLRITPRGPSRPWDRRHGSRLPLLD